MRPFAALDTSTDHLAIAVGDLDRPGTVVASADFASPRAANTAVLPALERLLADADIEVRQLAAVVCGRGPGSFTGVRIGVATAKGLAHGLGIPLLGVGTLDAVASRLAAAPGGLIAVVGDAMRGEVYPALFRATAEGVERLTADRVTRPEVVAVEWAALNEPLMLTGWGLAKHGAVMAAVLGPSARMAEEQLRVPDGDSLVAAAWQGGGPGSLVHLATLDPADALAQFHPSALLPVYTRLSDAEEAERGRAIAGQALPSGGVAGPEGGA
jgi:N6-L-threonylcarbamoyladenine synthase